MSTSRSAGRPRRALLHALVDDAAIFPPGNSPLPDAVRAHREHRSAPYADAVGPLLVRAGDAAELTGLLQAGEGLQLGLIVRPGSDPAAVPDALRQVQADGRGQVVAVELPVADPATLQPITDLGVPTWLEVSPASLASDLDQVLAAGAHAKLRTGGLAPADHPTEHTLATFLVEATRRHLRFKLTAGLHHAIRSTERSAGLEQHGVANVLSATAAALAGAGVDDVAALLADRDAGRVSARVSTLEDASLDATRAAFASFGCCGVTDPLRELAALGLADAHGLAAANATTPTEPDFTEPVPPAEEPS